MKMLFINPPFQRLKGIAQIYFPLGLGYLCSYISRDKRIDAMIYNAEVPSRSERLPFHVRYQDMLNLHKRYIQAIADEKHYVWQEVYKAIKEFDPDVIGITVLTAKYGSALKISQISKSLNKDCKVVWGGPHASVDAQRILGNDEVDFVIRGEGEAALKGLIELFIEGKNDFREELCNVQGLSYKIDSGIFHNPDRPLIEDLDALPPPSKNRVMFAERYLPSSWGDIITLRGCPFNCAYCGAYNTWTHKVRFRSPASVLEEVDSIISEYHNREFYFWDDNFTLDRERTLQLCRLLKGSKNRISWGCTTRVDLLDDLLVRSMKEAGCNYVSIGIETGSGRMLREIHKGISLEQAGFAVDLLNRHRLSYEAFFMIGFPDEKQEDIEQTFDFMKQLKKAKICFSIFTPYPNTQQYELARKYGLIPDLPDWSQFSHQSQSNHFMRNITKEQFKKTVEEMSAWIDKNNSTNIGIGALLWNAYLNFGSLIKRPALFINKLNTFLAIIKGKIRLLFNLPAETRL